MGPYMYLLEKWASYWWCYQNKQNIYYVNSNFFNPKPHVCEIFLPSFDRIEWKMEKPQLFQIMLFLALFVLNREKTTS